MGLPSPDPPERGRGTGTRLGCAEILLNSEFLMCLLPELHFPAVLGVGGIAPGSARAWRLWRGVGYEMVSLNLVTEAP